VSLSGRGGEKCKGLAVVEAPPQCEDKAVGLSITHPASESGLVIKKSEGYRNAELPRDNILACIRAYHLCGNTPRREVQCGHVLVCLIPIEL
jgi:hypothetical protein